MEKNRFVYADNNWIFVRIMIICHEEETDFEDE